MKPKERMIAAGKFKAECLALLDEVARSGQGITVTKRGRAVARLVPMQRLPPGSLAGTLEIVGDIVSPTGLRWDVTK